METRTAHTTPAVPVRELEHAGRLPDKAANSWAKSAVGSASAKSVIERSVALLFRPSELSNACLP